MPWDIWSARGRLMRDLWERLVSGERNSDSSQPSPAKGPLGHLMASRNPPAVTMSTNSVNRSISSGADSSQASQPQDGKGSVHQRPKRTKRPGKLVNATVIGAALESAGVSRTEGRAEGASFPFKLLVQAVAFGAMDVEGLFHRGDHLHDGGMERLKSVPG